MTKKAKKYFVSIFYHARSHFHDFFWYVGNHASDKETKDIIIKNISEELNGSAKSHEQMYFEFANSLGVDVSNEFIKEVHYLDFIRNFNHGHLEWLHSHDADDRFCALAAYERLDNLDYMCLLKLVKSLNVGTKGQIFFKIHSVVEHFKPTENKLKEIWINREDQVKKSFDFIANHQLDMWKKISDEISLF